MNVYKQDFNVSFKSDQSPLTDADLVSHNLIYDELTRLYPDIPILSEESVNTFNFTDETICYWCVDPLDGTKEFINKNDEFTVNIALIQNQKPIIGVIYAPAKKLLYAAAKGYGSFKQTYDDDLKSIHVKDQDISSLVFAVSRSHQDEETNMFVGAYDAKVLEAGSSLKLAYVAEGLVDVYPRYGPTMLWDIAAGQCIVEEAGGQVLCNINHEPLNYNVKKLKNSAFMAVNSLLAKPEVM